MATKAAKATKPATAAKKSAPKKAAKAAATTVDAPEVPELTEQQKLLLDKKIFGKWFIFNQHTATEAERNYISSKLEATYAGLAKQFPEQTDEELRRL